MLNSNFRRLRSAARNTLLALTIVAITPLWGLVLVENYLTNSEAVFNTFAQALSLIPGICGVFVRRGFYFMCLDSCARDVHVDFLSRFAHRRVSIGSGVYIGSNCLLGCVRIARDVTIGSNVDILSGRHQHGVASLCAPIQSQPGTFLQIDIGRNSWIGNSSVIMADVGAESIIGAGSVVVRPIPTAVIAFGNPCQPKRNREERYVSGKVPDAAAPNARQQLATSGQRASSPPTADVPTA